jgi:hypothetical protein
MRLRWAVSLVPTHMRLCSGRIAIPRRLLFRSGWQRSTKTRTPASQPNALSTDSAPCNAMPPTNAVRPRGKNNIVLAIHARLLDEPCSNRKRTFRASASAPVLARPPYWEPRSDGHDWTSGSNPSQTLRRAQCFPVTGRDRSRDPHPNPGSSAGRSHAGSSGVAHQRRLPARVVP